MAERVSSDEHVVESRPPRRAYGVGAAVGVTVAIGSAVWAFAGCAAYPFIDARVYKDQFRGEHVLDRARERPFRSAFGLSGIVFLVLVSIGAIDDRLGLAIRTTIDRVDIALGVLTLALPPVVFLAVLLHLRARRARRMARGSRRRLVTTDQRDASHASRTVVTRKTTARTRVVRIRILLEAALPNTGCVARPPNAEPMPPRPGCINTSRMSSTQAATSTVSTTVIMVRRATAVHRARAFTRC